MRQVFTSVKVVTPQGQETHPREGEAGVVHAVDPGKPDELAIKFDTDSQVQAVPMTHLKAL